jgi:hypothetical protein
MSFDPRALMTGLGVLIETSQDMALQLGTTLEEMTRSHRLAHEASTRAVYAAGSVHENAQTDQQQATRSKSTASAAHDDCRGTLDLCRKTESQATGLSGRARTCRDRWQRELVHAEADLALARTELSHAWAALNHCRSDPDNNCAAEAADVAAAERHLARAEDWCLRCRNSLAVAKEAVSIAFSAVATVRQSVSEAAQALQEAEDGVRHSGAACGAAGEGLSHAEQMVLLASRADGAVSEAGIYLSGAAKGQDEAQQSIRLMVDHLGTSISHLQELDRPDLQNA